MKTITVTYWITTGIIALMMLFSAWNYLTNPEMKIAFQHLGFSGSFRVELAVAKLLGSIILLAPVAGRWKEWAYAGFAFTFISAFIAHTVAGDPVANRMFPLLFLALLLVSYIAYSKRKTSLAQAIAA